MALWVIRQEDGGRWSASCGRTREDFGTEEEALRYLRKRQESRDRAVREEPDGYRIPLTRSRHWRR